MASIHRLSRLNKGIKNFFAIHSIPNYGTLSNHDHTGCPQLLVESLSVDKLSLYSLKCRITFLLKDCCMLFFLAELFSLDTSYIGSYGLLPAIYIVIFVNFDRLIIQYNFLNNWKDRRALSFLLSRYASVTHPRYNIPIYWTPPLYSSEDVYQYPLTMCLKSVLFLRAIPFP